MRKNLTEVVFIIDKSGSMHGLEKDTIGGFNSMLDKQRRESGEALISTVLFSDESDVIRDRADISTVKDMTMADYCAGGCTALLDAVGGAVHHIGNVHKYARDEDVPERTIFVIITDGMENASRVYSAEKVRGMIERQKQKYGWEFFFLGADLSAIETAHRCGIGRDRTVFYQSNPRGTRLNYEVMGDAVSCVRRGERVKEEWKERIEEDTKNKARD